MMQARATATCSTTTQQARRLVRDAARDGVQPVHPQRRGVLQLRVAFLAQVGRARTARRARAGRSATIQQYGRNRSAGRNAAPIAIE